MVSRPDRRIADCEIAKRAIAKRAIAEGEGRSPTFGGEPRGVDLEMVEVGKLEGEVPAPGGFGVDVDLRSEEHTSELQSLMRISYAVFCLKKKKTKLQAK